MMYDSLFFSSHKFQFINEIVRKFWKIKLFKLKNGIFFTIKERVNFSFESVDKYHLLEKFTWIVINKMRIIACLVVILAAICISANALLEVTVSSNGNPYNQYAVENMLSGKCSKTTGCYKNYCWAYCGTTDLSSGSWCYSTKTSSYSGNYVSCTTDEECDACWNCGGRCGII